jgi:hypothetical protein
MPFADKVLLSVANRKALGVDIAKAVDGMERERTMEGAPTITLTLNDDRHLLMDSQVLLRPAQRSIGEPEGWTLRPIDMALDGVVYRLTRASRMARTLEFEHRGAAYMKQHDWPITARRSQSTLALFIRRQVLEVGRRKTAPHRLGFWAPDLRKPQPIEDRQAETLSGAELDRNVAGVLDQASSLEGVTIRGAKADKEQRRNIALILAVAESEQAGAKATLAMVCAAIMESKIKVVKNPRSVYSGVFQADPSKIKPSDTQEQARCFLRGGKGFQGGGAIALAAAHPDWSAGQVALVVEGSVANFGGDVQRGTAFYDTPKNEAQDIIRAGGAGTLAETQLSSYDKPYLYRRERGEDAWECTGRYADLVNWRRFITDDTFIWAYDDALFKLPVQASWAPDDPWISEFDYDLDYGKTARAATMTVIGENIDKLRAGFPIIMRNAEGASGRWLVWSVSETDGANEARVELHAAEQKLKEPRSETVTRADPNDGEIQGDGSIVDKVIAQGKVISDQGLPYVWGGGHAVAGRPDRGTGRDPGIGYDCSGYTAACLLAAGVLPDDWKHGVPVSGTFASSWGEPGRGRTMTVWANATHVFIEVHGSASQVTYVDTSRQAGGGSGPRVRYGKRSTAGFTPRHWAGDEADPRSVVKTDPGAFPLTGGGPERA